MVIHYKLQQLEAYIQLKRTPTPLLYKTTAVSQGSAFSITVSHFIDVFSSPPHSLHHRAVLLQYVPFRKMCIAYQSPHLQCLLEPAAAFLQLQTSGNYCGTEEPYQHRTPRHYRLPGPGVRPPPREYHCSTSTPRFCANWTSISPRQRSKTCLESR